MEWSQKNQIKRIEVSIAKRELKELRDSKEAEDLRYRDFVQTPEDPPQHNT